MKINKIEQNIHSNILESHLKKIFSVIFEYHKNKKTIIFLGIPKRIENKYKKTFSKTRHIFLPEYYWINGLLTNKNSLFKYIKKRIFLNKKINIHNLQQYFSINRKPNLLVNFNVELNKNLLKESMKLKIPVINIFNEPNDNKVLYQISSNIKLNEKKYDKYVFNILYSVISK
jgi:ribosomal protein S2